MEAALHEIDQSESGRQVLELLKIDSMAPLSEKAQAVLLGMASQVKVRLDLAALEDLSTLEVAPPRRDPGLLSFSLAVQLPQIPTAAELMAAD